MRPTRKKAIKTVYKDEESEEDGDFSDSGSDAKFSAEEFSSEEEPDHAPSSGEEFHQKSNVKPKKAQSSGRKPRFAKTLIKKVIKQAPAGYEDDYAELPASQFSVKDLTDEDKLLPAILNLSESDSSDDESPNASKKAAIPLNQPTDLEKDSGSDNDVNMEYKDVWSNNIQDDSEEIAKKTFMELDKHKTKIEETKASLQNYTMKINSEKESDVKDLLAMGEEVIPEGPKKSIVKKETKSRRKKDDSDSEMEDWEEVKESKGLPQQGIQLFVEFPDAQTRKSKKNVDVEMMMKRKINRVKKEYQVYMHKVHVLCFIGHGNFVSRVLNDQELMAAVLSLVPSKECYPGERVDMKYVEQITTWYKDKLTLKQDKHEDKFKPKAPPLKTLLLEQIKSGVVTTRKYLVFIFVTMLRALGLQCRVMFNFVTLPLKPPSSELCSLSTKPKDEKVNDTDKFKLPTEKERDKKDDKGKQKARSSNPKAKKQKLAQVDGNDDSCLYSDIKNIMQVDGNDDTAIARKTRSIKRTKANVNTAEKLEDEEDVSPPKLPKRRTGRASSNPATEKDEYKNDDNSKQSQRGKKTNEIKKDDAALTAYLKSDASVKAPEDVSPQKVPRKRTGGASPKPAAVKDGYKNVDGSTQSQRGKTTKEIKNDDTLTTGTNVKETEDVSPLRVPKKITGRASPKRAAVKDQNINIDNNKRSQSEKSANEIQKDESRTTDTKPDTNLKEPTKTLTRRQKLKVENTNKLSLNKDKSPDKNTANIRTKVQNNKKSSLNTNTETKLNIPKISVTDENAKAVSSKYFENTKTSEKPSRLSRKRSQTANPPKSATKEEVKEKVVKAKTRTKSAPCNSVDKSKYFEDNKSKESTPKRSVRQIKEEFKAEDSQRVSHKDLAKAKKGKDDVTGDLVNIIKNRIKDAKEESKKGKVKGEIKKESDEDSDYLPVEDPKQRNSDSDEEFKPIKISPKPTTSRRIDRRVISSSASGEEPKKNRIDVWCEIFVEELEQWISVDVIKGKVHCTGDLYNNATHPVCYVVGWDNNNYLKDLTRKYVPHFNTVTRKLRAEALWWEQAIQPWLGPKTARNREEDEYLDRMQLDAPLPKSIGEYKNHPLYALKRHLLKFEALYPPDAAVLGFVRNEPVYARECVYTCRSREVWLKEAKVVKLGEKPYKIVKARPKWDKLSNKLITDKPLEIFGPWQVQDYEPPTAENGIVPRNPYGNVELFKPCMLPKKTVHLKLPGLTRVAKKLNIDCAPAMIGFDYSGGYAHPAYDGFVVCEEFEEMITEAWVKDQEEQERKEIEKLEARVYGNWKRLIKGLLIRERLKCKYGFEKPTTSETSKKSKGPRLVVKKKS